MKSGPTMKSMRLFRKCNLKRLGVDVKKVDKMTVVSIVEQYAEMERLDKLDQLKTSGHYPLNDNTVDYYLEKS